MPNTIVSVKPQFGVNYKVGYVGFTFTDNSFVSNGIAWFTRWERGETTDVPKLNISHCFIVDGENECIEATEDGVTMSSLTKYFNNPHNHVSFRKPIGLTDLTGNLIALEVSHQLGKPYDFSLIVGHVIDDTFLGKLFDKITNDKSREFITWVFSTKGRFICSESVAMALRSRPEYIGKGVLKHPPYSIDPQGLFQSTEIFSSWTEELQGEKV